MAATRVTSMIRPLAGVGGFSPSRDRAEKGVGENRQKETVDEDADDGRYQHALAPKLAHGSQGINSEDKAEGVKAIACETDDRGSHRGTGPLGVVDDLVHEDHGDGRDPTGHGCLLAKRLGGFGRYRSRTTGGETR